MDALLSSLKKLIYANTHAHQIQHLHFFKWYRMANDSNEKECWKIRYQRRSVECSSAKTQEDFTHFIDSGIDRVSHSLLDNFRTSHRDTNLRVLQG